MLGSYEITRGIKLVVGSVTEKVKGGFWGLEGIWGINVGQGGST